MKEHLISLGRDIARQLNPSGDHAWIAPMPESNWRVAVPWHELNHPLIRQVEVMEDKNGKPGQCRIYARPVDTHIPTIILSEHDVVARYAWRDGTPAYPLNGHPCEINLPAGLLSYPDEIKALPGVSDVLASCKRPMYSLRKSSFILSHITDVMVGDNQARAKTYINHFQKHQAFWHIMTPDEWSPLLPGQNIHGLIMTNASSYVDYHKEIPFVKIA